MPLPRLRPSAKTNGELLARIRIGAAGPDGYPDLRPLGFPFHFAAPHALYLRRIPDRKQVASARCPRKIQGQLVLRRGPAFGKNAQTLALCAQRRQMRGKADRKIIHHANPQMMLACAKRKMHARVLVARVRRRANRYRSAVKQSVPHVRSQTHRRGEVHLAVAAAPAALRIQGDFLLRPSEAQRQHIAARVEIRNTEAPPIRRNMRRERNRMFERIRLESQHPFHDWVYSNPPCPDFLRRTGRERLVVIAAPAEFGRVRGDDAHAPIGFLVKVGKLRNHRLRFVLVQQAEPHRHRGQHARLVDCALIPPDRKGKPVLLRDPKRLIELLLPPREIPQRFGRRALIPCRVRKAGKRSHGFRADSALIKLALDRQQRPALDPAVSDSEVSWQRLRVVGGLQKLISLPQAVPLLPGEAQIPARCDVIVCRNKIERRRICRCIRIRKILKPRNKTRSLRYLVRNFSIVALILADEFQRRARKRNVAARVQRQRRPERIAAEIPREPRPLALARAAVARHEPRPEKGIRDQPLLHVHPRPVIRCLQLAVRQIELHSLLQKIPVVLLRAGQQRVRLARQSFVRPLGVRGAARRSRNHNELPFLPLGRRAQPEGLDLRFRIVRLVFLALQRSARGSNQRREFPLLFAQIESVLTRIPVGIRSAERRRPLKLKIAMKFRLDLQRLFRFHIEKKNCAWFLHRREERLAHRERISRVKNRSAFRPYPNRPRQRFRRQRAVLRQKLHVELPENLQRIHPCFQDSSLVAKERRSRARRGEKFPRPCGARQYKPSVPLCLRLRENLVPRLGGAKNARRNHNQQRCGAHPPRRQKPSSEAS